MIGWNVPAKNSGFSRRRKIPLVKSLIKLRVKKPSGFESVNTVKMIRLYIEFHFHCMYYLLGELKTKQLEQFATGGLLCLRAFRSTFKNPLIQIT